MKNLFKSLTLAFGVAALTVSAMAQDSGPLLDALVKKGVLSDSEAEDIRVNLVKEYNSTSAGKLQISSFVKNLQLFGDARLRYEYRDIQTPRSASATNAGGGLVDTINDRYRYRLRIGATYTYDSHWSATVRLETGSTNDSANGDWGNYWDKNGNFDAIRVGQMFLTYKTKFSLFDGTTTVADGKSFKTVTDPGLTVGSTTQLGRGPKQILLSGAFFSVEANPEGLAQEFTFDNVGIDGLSFATRGAAYLTANDKAVAPGAGIATESSDDDGALFMAQLEGKYTFSSGPLKGGNIRIAPLFMQETSSGGLGLTDESVPVSGAAALGSNNSAGAISQQGNLTVVAIPVEVNWKSDWFGLFHKPIAQQLFGTYGANLDSGNRNTEMYGVGTHVRGNNTFWNAGYTLGQNKAKGDWSITPEWRWIEAASYTPNLTDSNFAAGVVNQQGLVLSGSYNITDAILFTGTYYHSTPINNSRGAGTVGGINSYGQIANQGQVDIFQADLMWKF